MSGHEDGAIHRSNGSLAGRRLLVVGASSGVGRAIGLAAAAQGAHVAFAARRLELLQTAVEEAGPPSVALGCDVTDESSVEEAVQGRPRPSGASTPSSMPPGSTHWFGSRPSTPRPGPISSPPT